MFGQGAGIEHGFLEYLNVLALGVGTQNHKHSLPPLLEGLKHLMIYIQKTKDLDSVIGKAYKHSSIITTEQNLDQLLLKYELMKQKMLKKVFVDASSFDFKWM